MKQANKNKSQAHNISRIFYYIGGTLIFFGICYLLFDNWNILAVLTRILLTLGIACWSLIFAVTLAKQDNTSANSAVFFLLGALLLPIGLSVTFNAMGMDNNFDIEKIVVAAICLSVFLLLQLRFPRDVLLLMCIIFGSTLVMAVTEFLNDQSGWMNYYNLISYQTFALGVGYLLLGYFVSTKNNALTGLLYFFGDLFILQASFHLGGLLLLNDTSSVTWEIIAPICVFLSFVLSIPLKSQSLLYLGTLFLIIYITSMTRKFAYLFGPLGWPIVLIGAGLFLMLLGYIFVVTQKNISKK